MNSFSRSPSHTPDTVAMAPVSGAVGGKGSVSAGSRRMAGSPARYTNWRRGAAVGGNGSASVMPLRSARVAARLARPK